MNYWVKAVCVAAAVGLGFTGVQMAIAQDTAPAADAKPEGKGKRGDRGGRGGARGGMIKAVLELQGLTEDQKTRLQALQTEFETKMKAMRSGAGETTGTASAAGGDREQRMTMMKEQRTKVEAILNDAQKAELATKLESMRGPGGKGGKRGEKPADQ